MNRIAASIVFLLLSLFAGAQEAAPDMADSLRENGKIYVVIGVNVVFFVSILIFLLFIERRLTRLEQSQNTKHSPQNK
jgi:hypothetical protein